MEKLKFEPTASNIINCLLYSIIGLLFVILQSGSLEIIFTVVGVMLISIGIIDIIKTKNTPRGIIAIAIGAIIIIGGWLIAEVFLLVLGILLIVKGVLEICNKEGNAINLTTSVITIIIGALLVIAKWVLMNVIFIIAGAVLIVNGILALFGKNVNTFNVK